MTNAVHVTIMPSYF